MRRVKALLTALCLVLAILIFNAPDVNYGYGPGHVREVDYVHSE